MADEIEIKYIVEKMPILSDDIKSEKIVQAYLQRSYGADQTKAFIDVKIEGEKAFILIEGKEIDFPQKVYECNIPVKDAKEILALIGLPEATKARLNCTTFTTRLRQLGNKGLITLKGEKVGIKQPEYEYEMDLDEVQAMFNICELGMIDKTRFYIPYGQFTIELDVFEGKNVGLILAEIELDDEKDLQGLVIPHWFSKDVSTDFNYTNAALSR